MKTQRNFRLSDEACARLKARAEASGISETQALEALILGRDNHPGNDQGSAAVARARLHTGTIDHEKIAAFQEKTGMSRWGKKRG